jgi:hypothetical protein
LSRHGQVCRAGRWIACYTAYGITGVMPHVFLCRMSRFAASELLHLDAA